MRVPSSIRGGIGLHAILTRSGPGTRASLASGLNRSAHRLCLFCIPEGNFSVGIFGFGGGVTILFGGGVSVFCGVSVLVPAGGDVAIQLPSLGASPVGH